MGIQTKLHFTNIFMLKWGWPPLEVPRSVLVRGPLQQRQMIENFYELLSWLVCLKLPVIKSPMHSSTFYSQWQLLPGPAPFSVFFKYQVFSSLRELRFIAGNCLVFIGNFSLHFFLTNTFFACICSAVLST